MSDFIVEDSVTPSSGTEPIKSDRPDFIEIGTSFGTLEIDNVLKSIAETNELNVTWQSLQQILDALISKQCKIMEEKIKNESSRKEVDELSMKITHSIHDHTNCPFTIQRLCELLIEPAKYYTMYIKYLRAVEKVLSVTSYWEDYVHSGKDEQMQVINSSDEVGSFPPSINYIELERHNFDIDTEEEEVSKNDQKETEEKKGTAETEKTETTEQTDPASTIVETEPDIEKMEVELKPDQEKEIEKEGVKMDLD